MIDTHQQSMLNSEQFLDQSFLKETDHKLNQSGYKASSQERKSAHLCTPIIRK